VEAIGLDRAELKQMLSLMGKLKNVSQMCSFLNSFKHPLNLVLAECTTKGKTELSDQSVEDLKI
jgi:hypothetical protein